jgi:ATP-dependent Clp protease ATP-binding subunit ClpA
MNFFKWALLRQCSHAGLARYTKKARAVVFHAYDLAQSCGDREIRPEHLLLGIIAADKSLARRLGLPTADAVFSGCSIRKSDEHIFCRPSLSQAAKNIMSCAAEERERLGHVHTGTEHLLLGITRVEGSPAELLRQHGIDVAQVRHALEYRISTISWNVVESVRA